jgi:hypothetical protein
MLGAQHVASFIGHEAGKALFVGLYSIGASNRLTRDDFWRIPAYRELKAFGLRGFNDDDPRGDELDLSWEDLRVLPTRLEVKLSEWRAIYYIFDASDGKGYVGSAYGGENLLGRWRNYGAVGHGGNRLLRHRDPHNFRFSILQRVSPDMDAADVIRLESSWKERLHARQPWGLNDN